MYAAIYESRQQQLQQLQQLQQRRQPTGPGSASSSRHSSPSRQRQGAAAGRVRTTNWGGGTASPASAWERVPAAEVASSALLAS